MVKEEKEERRLEMVGSMGHVRTYFTLLKGFIGTGILYMPQQFYFAGWGFSLIAMMVSFILALYCCYLLLISRDASGASSFTELAEITYGKRGRVLAEVSLVVS